MREAVLDSISNVTNHFCKIKTLPFGPESDTAGRHKASRRIQSLRAFRQAGSEQEAEADDSQKP